VLSAYRRFYLNFALSLTVAAIAAVRSTR